MTHPRTSTNALEISDSDSQMNATSALDGKDGNGTVVSELLDRRATVRQWLKKLDAQRGTVSEKILARVRADYETRLREAVDALGAHREALDGELHKATERLDEAREEHTSAREALEEGRLRNAIGELDEEAWSSERGQLESAVEAAAEREGRAREDVERLRELLDQFAQEEPTASGASPIVAQESPPPLDPEVTTELPPAQTASFLSDIDRAISDDDETTRPEGANADELPSEETSPKPGLKCPECGYTNDLSAWFCGVCGADIG